MIIKCKFLKYITSITRAMIILQLDAARYFGVYELDLYQHFSR